VVNFMKGEILMSHPTDRPLRTVLALALGTALIGTPLGVAAAGDIAGGAEFRLAQAAPKPGAPKAQAQQQAPEQGIERQVSELKKRLNITPQQQTQFDAFAQAMRQNAQTMEPLLQEQQQSPNRSAVEDLKAAAKFAEAEADALKRLLPPMQALYDSLSDPQKKVADQVLASSAGADQPPPPPQAKKR
jgi:periplasmic protein CpxP/Spy